MKPETVGLATELRPRAREAALLLKALAHEDRLVLLCELAGADPSRGCTVSQLTRSCGISQSQTSQFLARLRTEGWVSARREGQMVHYSIADARVGELLRTLKEIFCPKVEPIAQKGK